MIKFKSKFGLSFPEKVFPQKWKGAHISGKAIEDWEDELLPNYRNEPQLQISIWLTTSILIIAIISFFIIFVRLFNL